MIASSAATPSVSAIFWMLDGIGNTRWHLLPAPLIAVTLGLAWIYLRASALDALLLGEEGAHTLGIAVKGLRLEMFIAASVVAGVLVSGSGAIGFIGLMIPHIARWSAGAQMRVVVPVAALFGAIFTIWVDAAARTLLAPMELPLGVLTAAFGGIFFLVLMRRGLLFG